MRAVCDDLESGSGQLLAIRFRPQALLGLHIGIEEDRNISQRDIELLQPLFQPWGGGCLCQLDYLLFAVFYIL